MTATHWSQPRTLRLGERVSLRIAPRPVVVSSLMIALLLALFVFALARGSTQLDPVEVIKALFRHGTRRSEYAVHEVRLPRATLAIVCGAALGISGALFQSVTGNPLASPDVIGMQGGAATGALLQILVLGASGTAVVAGALTGGILAALIVLAIVPLRQAGGYRFILVGIAVAALFTAVNDYLVTRSDLTSAIAAALWQTGSLNNATWSRVIPAAVALAVLLPVALWVSSGLRILALGDDLAAAVGARVTTIRLVALAVGIVLAATATAGSGPLLFVALAAGQIGRRLVGRAAPTIVAAGLVGAALTLGADLVAQRIIDPGGLPVGILTGILGGIYLSVLLAMQWRRA